MRRGIVFLIFVIALATLGSVSAQDTPDVEVSDYLFSLEVAADMKARLKAFAPSQSTLRETC